MNYGMRLSEGFYLSSFISGGAIGIIASIIWIINVFTEEDDILFIISLGTNIIASIYGTTIFVYFGIRFGYLFRMVMQELHQVKRLALCLFHFLTAIGYFNPFGDLLKIITLTFNDTDLITLNYRMACFLRIVSWFVAPYCQGWA